MKYHIQEVKKDVELQTLHEGDYFLHNGTLFVVLRPNDLGSSLRSVVSFKEWKVCQYTTLLKVKPVYQKQPVEFVFDKPEEEE